VIAGHGRLKASLELGLDNIPVAYQDFANEAEENLHMLADNRLAELAEMDNSMLKNLIEELDTGDIDLNLTGFSESEIGSLMSQFFQGDDTGDDPTDKLEVMKNTVLRQIMLVYKQEEFEEMIDALVLLKEKGGYETNQDCITALIRKELEVVNKE
jgi:ParB-like chromosome segregation protein Spo0J